MISIVGPELKNSYEVYELCTRQYLGWGALLQFIPKTNANLARKQLSKDLEPCIEILKEAIRQKPVVAKLKNYKSTEFYVFKKYAHLFSLNSYFNLGFLFRLLDDIRGGFDFAKSEKGNSLSLPEIVLKFPILNDLELSEENQKNALKNVLHSILNPARIIDDALEFLQQSIYGLLEIRQSRPNYDDHILPRISVPKLIVSLVFGVIKLPVKVVKFAIDVPLSLADSIIVDPVVHIVNSIKDAFHNRNKKVLVVSDQELRDVKELRRAAKGREDINYSKITRNEDYTQEYIGITKNELFTSYDNKLERLMAYRQCFDEKNDEDRSDQLRELNEKGHDERPERLIAIRASDKKITSTASLLAIVNVFSANHKKAQLEPEAIEQAQRVLLS